MPTLYHHSGAQGYTVEGLAITDAEWSKRLGHLERILTLRKQSDAVALLRRFPWKVYLGDNYFHDEFEVLYAYLDTAAYVEAGGLERDETIRTAARVIATTYGELGMGYLRFIGFGLRKDDDALPAPPPEPTITSATVRRALEDAELLLAQGRATSAVDRAHTALHGYLTERARRLAIDVGASGSARLSSAALYKRIRQAHPAFQVGIHAEHAGIVGQTFANVVDRMDTLRNNASVAHPNDELLDEPEAQLVITAVWAILRYLDARLTPLD